ncbi:hypothetical protein HK100_007286, partial [Physocladia obscura]
MNRLKDEKSPYLLQHKNNPVDWFEFALVDLKSTQTTYPWGSEALKLAKDFDKPILLSVGYSTCHWCHVMAHESFENADIANLMNKYFVNIKVDREERPTVDRMYMSYVQALTGHGGWPMTVLLTPDLKPFFGGTYFAPVAKYDDINEINRWIESKEEILKASSDDFEKLRDASRSISSTKSIDDISPLAIPSKTYAELAKTFDSTYGGFGDAPKFPTPVVLNFLLTYYYATKIPAETLKKFESSKSISPFKMTKIALKYGVNCDNTNSDELQTHIFRGLKNRAEESQEALNMVDFTMKKISAGGIHDHVGSGFHRYSVDRTWLVPQFSLIMLFFEKMLYDQAQLLSVYADLAIITKNQDYVNVCNDIIKYLQRDLKDSNGAFYSAEDADSKPDFDSAQSKEGAFAVWEAKEIDEALRLDAPLFRYHFGVNPGGNINSQFDPHDELLEKNILMERHTIEETADKFDTNIFVVQSTIAKCLEQLWNIRQTRPKPHRDDKIMVAWNGLVISALAKTGRCLNIQAAKTLAVNSATFIRANMYNLETKTLTRVYGTQIPAYADDYAFLIDGLIELFQSTHDEVWIQWASELQDTMDSLFWDAENGGYFTGMKGEE